MHTHKLASNARFRDRSIKRAAAKTRTEKGIFLVELLIAMVMAALVSLALYEGYAATLRASTDVQQQVIAATIAQEALDSARNLTWNGGLKNMVSIYPPSSPENLTVSGSQLTLSNGRVLGVNTDMSYTNESIDGQFQGTCTRSFSQSGGTEAPITVVATVTWKNGSRTLSSSTIVSRDGMHN